MVFLFWVVKSWSFLMFEFSIWLHHSTVRSDTLLSCCLHVLVDLWLSSWDTFSSFYLKLKKWSVTPCTLTLLKQHWSIFRSPCCECQVPKSWFTVRIISTIIQFSSQCNWIWHPPSISHCQKSVRLQFHVTSQASTWTAACNTSVQHVYCSFP